MKAKRKIKQFYKGNIITTQVWHHMEHNRNGDRNRNKLKCTHIVSKKHGKQRREETDCAQVSVYNGVRMPCKCYIPCLPPQPFWFVLWLWLVRYLASASQTVWTNHDSHQEQTHGLAWEKVNKGTVIIVNHSNTREDNKQTPACTNRNAWFCQLSW